ncbi:choice-of-anchor Q domain-containing protein [Marinicella sp. W31]|uniref:choice-of-anchor Q domain-containing protein n=1 Tax=Marinicella sp. W31 TaxID=3023713 RepID=UPI003757FB66
MMYQIKPNCLILVMLLFLKLSIHESQAATYTVTRTDDPLPQECTVTSCSLREAVIAANNNPGEDVVLLMTDEYVLSLVGAVNDKFHTGDLDVLDTLIIRHVAPIDENDRFTILGNMNERVIDIHPNANLTLQNAVVTGGKTTGLGGGIMARGGGTLIIKDSQISSNEASRGGALSLNDNQVVMNAVSMTDNHVTDNGGGIYVLGSSQVTMNNVNVTGNTAKGGGGLYFGYLNEVNNQYNIHITNSFFGDNRAVNGGALNVQGSFGETAGSILIENTDFVLNQAEQRGGAIYHLETQLTIKSSLFQLNQTESNDAGVFGDGGAIYSDIVADISDLTIEQTLFERNRASHNGGGIHLEGNNTMITNTTFSNNKAGIHAAINAFSGDLSLKHVTIFTDGIDDSIDVLVGSGASFDIQNSIIKGRCQVISINGFQSLGGNIESPGNSCGFGTGLNDLVNVAPRFLKLEDGLEDNGGSTRTHAIRYDYSFAVGNAISIDTIKYDQRHMSRDVMPDSGAFEVHESDLILIFKNGFE